MRFHEITPEVVAEIASLGEEVDFVVEAKPRGSVKPNGPLSPAQARARAEKQTKAAQNFRDVQAANAVRLQKARRRLGDV